jgi:hypothetical protein
VSEEKKDENKILDSIMNAEFTDDIKEIYVAFSTLALLYPFLALGEISSQIVGLLGKILTIEGIKVPDLTEDIVKQYRRYEKIVMETTKKAFEAWIKEFENKKKQ